MVQQTMEQVLGQVLCWADTGEEEVSSLTGNNHPGNGNKVRCYKLQFYTLAHTIKNEPSPSPWWSLFGGR